MLSTLPIYRTFTPESLTTILANPTGCYGIDESEKSKLFSHNELTAKLEETDSLHGSFIKFGACQWK